MLIIISQESIANKKTRVEQLKSTKSPSNTKCYQGCETNDFLHIAGRKLKWYTNFGK